MLVVKGEFVLLIMPSRFIAIFPFKAFLTLSNSFLMFFIIWLLPWVDCAVCSKISYLLFPGLWALLSLSLRLHRDCDVLMPSGCAFRFKSSISSTLAHELLVLEFVEPSPPGSAVQSWLSPSILKNLVSREFNGLWSIPIDGAKLMKHNLTSSVCSSLEWWTTWYPA